MRHVFKLIGLLFLSLSSFAQNFTGGFQTPPDSTRIAVYWYWLSGNISHDGVIRDLEAMKKAGIGRVFIGNVTTDGTPTGPVRFLSDEWWDVMHTALKTATKLDIEVGIFHSPGWSGTGGPWVTPAQSMRYLTSSEVIVQGSSAKDIQLPIPIDSFQDVKVLAFPMPKSYDLTTKEMHATVASTPALQNLSALMDDSLSNEVRFPDQHGDSIVINIQYPSAYYPISALIITPGQRRMQFDGVVTVDTKEGRKQIGSFTMERSNDELNTGFEPYGPLTVALPLTVGTTYRVVIRHWSGGSGIRELKLAPTSVVSSYVEKTLGKMFPTPQPTWYDYQWPEQQKASSLFTINPAEVQDITSSMDKNGVLHWNKPPGDYVVMRTGMTPTLVKNAPAPPEGTGLQGDKMSEKHVAENFDAFLGQIIRRVPAEDRKSFKIVVQDSYEVGGQNWTDGMIDSFKVHFGYDPTPYIPAMMGHVVGSEDQSDRFLWDLRRFIADRLAYGYVGGLSKVSHQNGLKTWLENYGHWGFPGEFLQYGGQSDEVAGEFWAEGGLGDIENRAAASSAHTYGKTKVWAESFTAALGDYARYPAVLKARADRFFTEGINASLLHVYISQPDERLPGINAWFSTEFNRHNTWFPQLDLFTTYLKRCNYMLQQGRYVADVAYFIGEDAPKMTGVRDPEIPKGYSYDYINAEVIKNRLSIKDGRWTLPDGLSYKVLVLPKLKTMRPEVLQRLATLVQQGGILLGPAPERSPSLQDYGHADEKVRQLADQLWKKKQTGKGKILTNTDLQTVFKEFKVSPDFVANNEHLLFIHRTTPTEEIYFVSNQSDKPQSVSPAFRVKGKTPVLWDPVLGETKPVTSFKEDGDMTTVQFEMAGNQSYFVVFSKDAPKTKAKPENTLFSINTPWTVQFDTAKRGPAKVVFDTLTDWTKSADSTIRFYSGNAVYTNTFELKKAGQSLYLDLGLVRAMAKVKINGQYVGGVWTAPYVVNISKAAKAGKNIVEVEVVNTWMNRLIGDSRLPEKDRKTWTNIDPYRPNSEGQSSGLLGPVKVMEQ
jgi:hypothetical protein